MVGLSSDSRVFRRAEPGPAYALLHANSELQSASPAFYEMFSATAEQLQDVGWLQFIPMERLDSLTSAVRDCRPDNSVSTYLLPAIESQHTGDARQWQCHISLVRSASPTGGRDVSDMSRIFLIIPFTGATPDAALGGMICRLLAEKAEAETAAETAIVERDTSVGRLNGMAEAIGGWMWETDVEHRFRYITPSIEKFTGVTAESHYGLTRKEMRSPSVDPVKWDRHLEALERHEPFEPFEYERVISGRKQWMRTAGAPVFDAEGNFRGYRGAAVNIDLEYAERTQRERAEQAAHAAHDLLTQALEQIHEGFVLWSKDRRLVLCNSTYRSFYPHCLHLFEPGIEFRDLLEKSLKLRGVNSPHERKAIITRRLQEFDETSLVIERQLQNGRWLLVNESAMADGGRVGVYTDITDLKKQAKSLAEMASNYADERERAEMGSRAKSSFLASMSHEIRTPLNGVLGMVSLLMESDMTEDQRQQVAIIRDCGETLLSLLNDILDLSKVEAGKLDLEEININLGAVINRVKALWEAKAAEKNLNLTFSIAPDVPKFVVGDPVRIQQVLSNFVNNAIKFTEQGEISVRVARAPEEKGQAPTLENSVRLLFEVTDTGRGIDPAYQKRLFEKFTQADVSTSRKHGGTGLGLSICKQLAALMGGDVGLESELEKGSKFWFTALFAIGETIAPADSNLRSVTQQTAGKVAGRRLKILVAEDNKVNQVVTQSILMRANHSVRIVENGVQAVAAAQEEKFDVILMDIQMPEMDGIEAAGAIRRLPGAPASVPIIALTANAMFGDAENYIANGMTDYVSKPINPALLFQALAGVLGDDIAVPPVHSGEAGSVTETDGNLWQAAEGPAKEDEDTGLSSQDIAAIIDKIEEIL